jgi:hypothetical protein
MDHMKALQGLKRGIADTCADDILEVICNLADGTCDDVTLVPLLEEIAKIDMFFLFDDNSAGGFPRPSGQPSSYRQWALDAIENIQANTLFAANSMIAKELKSIDTQTVRIALKKISKSKLTDENLIPILEKIAKKDKYDEYSYIGGWKSPKKLGQLAENAILRIQNNVKSKSANV